MSESSYRSSTPIVERVTEVLCRKDDHGASPFCKKHKLEAEKLVSEVYESGDVKKCNLCELKLPRILFHKSPQTVDGIRYACAECERRRRKDRYYKNEKRRKSQKTQRRTPSYMSTKITSRVDKNLHEGIRFLSDAFGVTQSVIIERALKAYVVQNMPQATRIMHNRRQKR